MSYFGVNAGNLSSEVILLQPVEKIIAGGFFSNKNTVSFQLSFNLTGGTASLTILKGSGGTLPPENTVISLPKGRLATLKSVGSSYSSGGLLDVMSGPAVQVVATLINSLIALPGQLISLAQAAGVFNGTLVAGDYQVKNFSFRGANLAGLQQVASYVLNEVLVRSGGIFIVAPGATPPGASAYSVPQGDIISVNQQIDYSSDVAAVLNPALSQSQVNFIDDGDFIYDSEHAQKQPKFTVQAGAPGAQGSSDFIPIPDGWLVDGNFEEWTPQSVGGTNPDLTNPNPTPTNGRYWKTFQSPTNPGMMRGITSFTRLVKQINIPKNVSTFVGSPITGLTQSQAGGIANFDFNSPGTESGITGFNAEETQLFDVVSNQFLDIPNAIVLIPASSVDTGFAASNFYTITMEEWFFPKVAPTVFPIGDPTNPFSIPKNVVVVTPNSNVVNAGGGYNQKYLFNYRLANSPRLRTTVSCVYRGTIPDVGDGLSIVGVDHQNCGRISAVSINFGRSGITLTLTAEIYQFSSGLWNSV